MRDLFSFRGRVSRRRYFLTGALLFVVKVALDETVSNFVFHRAWNLANYYSLGTVFEIKALTTADFVYYAIMLLCASPFIIIGLAMTVRRLTDVNLPKPLALIFIFRPFNWLLILALSILRRNTIPVYRTYENWSLAKFISQDESARGAQAISASFLIGGIMTYFGVCKIDTYGDALFIGVPTVMGYVVGWIDSYYDINIRRSIILSVVTPVILALILIIIAFEGIICLLMAAPIVFVFILIGVLAGIWTARSSFIGKRNYISCSPIVALPLFMFFEAATLPPPPLLHVRSEVIVNAPIQTVWDHVISFPTIAEPHELLFKAGIAYPIDATIIGRGPGAVRHCNFSTGTFVEPIITWNEPRLLQFSVAKEPEPMKELSPYNIHPPHLKGYLECERGEFRLIPLSKGRTEMIGTTWYRDNIWPQEYWSLYSNAIIHKIHLRVLNHIKAVSERSIETHRNG